MSLESSQPSDYPFIPRSELPYINEQIAHNDTWKRLWHWLGLPDPGLAKSTRSDDWWAISPLRPSEKTPSFHMNTKGWSCFATGRNGSFLSLAAELLAKNIYHAAHDVREALLGTTDSPVVEAAQEQVQRQAKSTLATEANPPIRADLTKSKYFSASDPRFDDRGIPIAIFEQLGAGFLDRPERKDGRPDPMNRRHIFQVRGVRGTGNEMQPVILTHLGRASSEDQVQKWWMFPGFKKRFELYNIDQALLEPVARQQAKETGHVVVAEGAYDVARLLSAGIGNVVATFGKELHTEQIPRFELLADHLDINRFLIFYDRGQDGRSKTVQGAVEDGAIRAAELLTEMGFEAELFRWDRTFSNAVRHDVGIPDEIGDPCEFAETALRWFRSKQLL